MSILSDEIEPPRQRNYWLYGTIALAVVLLLGVTLFVLSSLEISSLRDYFKGSMKVEGEIFIVTQGRGNIKLGLVEVCAIPEREINIWIDQKQTTAKFESEKARKNLSSIENEKRVAESELNSARQKNKRIEDAYYSDILNPNFFAQYTRARDEEERKRKRLIEIESRLLIAKVSLNRWNSPEYYFDGIKGCESVAKTNSDGRFTLNLKSGKYALAAKSNRKVIDDTEIYYWLVWISPEIVAKEPLMLSNDNLMDSGSPLSVVTTGPVS